MITYTIQKVKKGIFPKNPPSPSRSLPYRISAKNQRFSHISPIAEAPADTGGKVIVIYFLDFSVSKTPFIFGVFSGYTDANVTSRHRAVNNFYLPNYPADAWICPSGGGGQKCALVILHKNTTNFSTHIQFHQKWFSAPVLFHLQGIMAVNG